VSDLIFPRGLPLTRFHPWVSVGLIGANQRGPHAQSTRGNGADLPSPHQRKMALPCSEVPLEYLRSHRLRDRLQ